MKKVIMIFIIFMFFFGFGNASGDVRSKIFETQIKNIEFSKLPNIIFENYFHPKVGDKIIYKIELGNVEPLYYRKIFWPQIRDHSSSTSRGIFFAAANEENRGKRRTFTLALKIKDIKRDQREILCCGHFAFELIVETDELGVYQGARRVIWEKSRFGWNEILVFSLCASVSPTGHDTEGFSTRPLSSNNLIRKVETNSIDDLILIGEGFTPGTKSSAIHFVRMVHDGKNINGDQADNGLYLNKAFEEHTYFVKGKGLVFLEQKVEGKTSMTWRLVGSDKK